MRLSRTATGVVLLMGAVALDACGSAAIPPTPSPTAPAAPTDSPAPTALPDGVLASIPLLSDGLAEYPSGSTIGFGSVWIENHRGNDVFRVDPSTNAVVATIDIGQSACANPVVGAGRVWFGPCGDSVRTIAIDPTTNQVAGRLDALGGYEAFTPGAMWISSSTGKLLKVDPTTYSTIATFDPFPGSFVGGITGDGKQVWVANEDLEGNWQGEIARIDPTTGSVAAKVAVPDPGQWAFLNDDGGFVWVKGNGNGRLSRISTADASLKTFDLGETTGPTSLYDIFPTVGLGSVWLLLNDGVVTRVDEKTGKVLGTYAADPLGGGGTPAVGFGSLWIVNFGTNTIWRDRIAP